jgi:myo-inositol-1(or 4)-monophosphatase
MRPIDLTAFIEGLARQSGEAILPFFRTALAVSDKNAGESLGHFDPVTEADRAAEAIIRRRIVETFPHHGILGEEFPSERLDADHVWVIDPIDGTRAFLCGLPVWGTLIGLKHKGVPVLGVMHQPYTGEMFLGDGGLARVKGPRGERLLSTRPCRLLADATVMTTDPRLFEGAEARAYRAVENAVRLVRYGADCYAYAMLAAGQVDLVIESGLKPYDIVALIPIIEGAGGIITTWQGEPATEGGRILASATPELHNTVLTILQGFLNSSE